MRPMEHPTTDTQPTLGPRRTQAEGADKDERDIPHFESLTLPDLMSLPLFYEWLRKPFRRKDTVASR